MPASNLPEKFFLPDYLLHLFEYLPLGFLMCRAIKNTNNKISLKRSCVLSIVLVILYAGSDEFHQSFVVGRDASLLDLFFDGVGSVIGIGIAV